ncbi:Helitron helicase [Phytophthora megakarya]|uniref:Helitron helicase n=1 Tax=Phytophthora megakarya TaxID=4795 RepID=A0A225W3A3_9STRA|nr:Helitron helicase [Phytophthora megakarya]
MVVVRQFEKPDLFVTVTTNPKCKEIQDELLPGLTSSDRPDIVTRVFKMKLNALLDDITKNGIFRKVAAFVYVDHWKPRNSSDYDKFVSAEIPDPALFPEPHATVTICMIHGPCGRGIKSPCTGEDGVHVCSKRFPKAFFYETRVDSDGYPLYRRRRPGPLDPYNEEGPHRPTSTRMVSRQIHHINATRTRSTVQVDNRRVVPYNPYLCQKYNCHVNVEVCSTVQSVKHLYKYVYKGQGRTTVVLREARLH